MFVCYQLDLETVPFSGVSEVEKKVINLLILLDFLNKRSRSRIMAGFFKILDLVFTITAVSILDIVQPIQQKTDS